MPIDKKTGEYVPPEGESAQKYKVQPKLEYVAVIAEIAEAVINENNRVLVNDIMKENGNKSFYKYCANIYRNNSKKPIWQLKKVVEKDMDLILKYKKDILKKLEKEKNEKKEVISENNQQDNEVEKNNIQGNDDLSTNEEELDIGEKFLLDVENEFNNLDLENRDDTIITNKNNKINDNFNVKEEVFNKKRLNGKKKYKLKLKKPLETIKKDSIEESYSSGTSAIKQSSSFNEEEKSVKNKKISIVAKDIEKNKDIGRKLKRRPVSKIEIVSKDRNPLPSIQSKKNQRKEKNEKEMKDINFILNNKNNTESKKQENLSKKEALNKELSAENFVIKNSKKKYKLKWNQQSTLGVIKEESIEESIEKLKKSETNNQIDKSNGEFSNRIPQEDEDIVNYNDNSLKKESIGDIKNEEKKEQKIIDRSNFFDDDDLKISQKNNKDVVNSILIVDESEHEFSDFEAESIGENRDRVSNEKINKDEKENIVEKDNFKEEIKRNLAELAKNRNTNNVSIGMIQYKNFKNSIETSSFDKSLKEIQNDNKVISKEEELNLGDFSSFAD